MITPTVGRVMHYWPEKAIRGVHPFAAIVAGVWDHPEATAGDANLVNLAVFDSAGDHFSASRVPVVQDGSPYTKGDSAYAEWMPYQLGQAAKTEAAQKTAVDASEHPMGKLVLAVSDILRVSYPHLDELHETASGNHAHDQKASETTGL